MHHFYFRRGAGNTLKILLRSLCNAPPRPPMAAQADKNDHSKVDELSGADYDAPKHRRKFELQVHCEHRR